MSRHLRSLLLDRKESTDVVTLVTDEHGDMVFRWDTKFRPEDPRDLEHPRKLPKLRSARSKLWQ